MFTNIGNLGLPDNVEYITSLNLQTLYLKRQESHQSKQWSGEFAQNLWAYKKSQYNVRNYNSGRHNRWHTFRRRESNSKSISTNIPSYDLKFKGINSGKTKPTSQQSQMLHAIKHCQDIFLWKSTRIVPPFLLLNEPNSCIDCIFRDQKYNDQLYFLN